METAQISALKNRDLFLAHAERMEIGDDISPPYI